MEEHQNKILYNVHWTILAINTKLQNKRKIKSKRNEQLIEKKESSRDRDCEHTKKNFQLKMHLNWIPFANGVTSHSLRESIVNILLFCAHQHNSSINQPKYIIIVTSFIHPSIYPSHQYNVSLIFGQTIAKVSEINAD